MFRTTDVILIGVMIAAAGFTYLVKHDAEAGMANVRKLQEQIRFEQDMINVLKADWSLLTQPVRMEKLANAYKAELGLQLVDPTQIGGLNRLPARPLEIEDILNNPEALAATASARLPAGRVPDEPSATDRIQTGSISVGDVVGDYDTE